MVLEKKKTIERMMNSQESMNQLAKTSQKRQKGKAILGYTKQGESSQQGAQSNTRPTRNHCGKIGHTSKKCWGNRNSKFNGNVTVVTNMDIRQVNAQRKLSLKENVSYATKKFISLQSVEPRIGILLNKFLNQYLVVTTTLVQILSLWRIWTHRS